MTIHSKLVFSHAVGDLSFACPIEINWMLLKYNNEPHLPLYRLLITSLCRLRCVIGIYPKSNWPAGYLAACCLLTLLMTENFGGGSFVVLPTAPNWASAHAHLRNRSGKEQTFHWFLSICVTSVPRFEPSCIVVHGIARDMHWVSTVPHGKCMVGCPTQKKFSTFYIRIARDLLLLMLSPDRWRPLVLQLYHCW